MSNVTDNLEILNEKYVPCSVCGKDTPERHIHHNKLGSMCSECEIRLILQGKLPIREEVGYEY